MRKVAKNQFDWKGRIETLEDRRVMSADPLLQTIEHHYFEEDEAPQIEHQLVSEPDFWLDVDNLIGIEDQLNQIEQTLYSAHNTTGLNSVVANYGFTGIGQTVAVIDSGIAYDHFALGGGFGANYRVVGGWDFTGENDANPYDDGPEGSHGTHVAGIIGGTEGNDKGVAPGVDLVALRVFDDAGNGYFSWVENALRWVLQNRNSFENPITAINLSLGVSSWNSNTVPSWSTLEDEFQQLEAAGIFIAVSAGNAYASFNTPGLGYPAASPYVVPVMSVTDSGVLASYSQRDTRAIAAPGSAIRSTVPDYRGNNNGIADDYANFSGTSMASPYIAGASVLIRQAMQFVGRTNITQDMIYDHMMATATSFVDSSTGLTFKRLNLGAAISALMPTDDYGSTTATAHNLGSLNGTLTRSGVISTLTDVDYFRFTAASTGRVTFTASDTTHQMDAAWTLASGTGTLSNNGDTFSFDVVAGQTYTVGLSSSGGLGYYDLEVATQNTFSYTDWGTVSYSQLTGLSAAGETWYRVAASQAGYVTVESMFGTQSGQLNLQLYNADRSQLLDTGNAANGSSRVDAYATAGQEFYLCVIGTNSDVDYRLSNLVSVSGTTVNVTGTSAADAFSFVAGSTHQLSINGVSYSYSSMAVNRVVFNGRGGQDSIAVTGTAANDFANLRTYAGSFSGAGYAVEYSNTENVTLNGGGGEDTARFYDSAGNDIYESYTTHATMTGGDWSNRANNFLLTYGYSTTGTDIARLYDSSGDDTFRSYSTYSTMSNSTHYSRAENFDQVFAYASSGYDRSFMYDSAGNDTYETRDSYAIMSGSGYQNRCDNFEATVAYGSTGTDTANLYDSAGDDLLRSYSDRAVMTSSVYYHRAEGFDSTIGHSSTGNDRAWLYDSSGVDNFESRPTYSIMSGGGYSNRANGFDQVIGYASNATDVARMYDSTGNDVYRAYADRVVMTGTGYNNSAYGFSTTFGYASTGNDQASLYDTPGDDLYEGYATYSVISNSQMSHRAEGFDFVYAYSTAGNDTARLYDSAGSDLLRVYHDSAVMSGSNFNNRAQGFRTTRGYSSSSDDLAYIYDSIGNDALTMRNWGASMAYGNGSVRDAHGFDTVRAWSTTGGSDTLDNQVTDYVFQQYGNWI